jgi:hypothetical protein
MFGFNKVSDKDLENLRNNFFTDDPFLQKKSNLQEAIKLAHAFLLMEMASIEDIRKQAELLRARPQLYSTHDLAIAVALELFREPANIKHLREAQLLARGRALEWYQQGLLSPIVLQQFEQTLYELNK